MTSPAIKGLLPFFGILSGLTFADSAQAVENANTSLFVNGPGQEMRVSHSPGLNITSGQMTMEGWVRPTETSGFSVLIKGFLGTAWDYGMVVYNGNGVSFANTGGLLGTDLVPITVGAWTHLAVTVNDITRERVFYINGIAQGGVRTLDGNIGDGGLIGNTSGDLHIGFNAFHGYMDEVRIWDRVLDSGAIAAGMNLSMTGTEEGLIGYWNWDDGTGLDSSGNGNHGEFIGGAGVADGGFTFGRSSNVPESGGTLGLAALGILGVWLTKKKIHWR